MRPAVAAALIVLSSAAACAPQTASRSTAGPVVLQAGASGPRQCFNASSVSGFRVVNDRTVDLDVGANRSYRAELLGTCPDVRGALGVGIQTQGGSGFVCDDLDLELIVPSESRQDIRRCPVTALRRLSDAEIAARRQRR